MENDNASPNIDLSEDQNEKLQKFRDLTGIEHVKCLQILQANDWNLEVALDLALDGAYNEDQAIYNNQPTNDVHTNSPQLRHRHAASANNPPTVDDATEPTETTNASENPNPESQGLTVTLWNTTTWLFKLPFIIVINTLNTLYDFFATLIRPTLNYDANGTVERFIAEFEEKYGTTHPTFFRGNYSQLLEQGKKDIRFTLIYLHSPSHRDTDRFCTNVISTQRFTNFINTENVIFWSCSVYYPEGYRAYQSLKANTYPFMALVGLKNHKMVLMKKFEGYYELEPFLMGLKSALNNNEYSLIAARVDRDERNMAHLLRNQQDIAFEESLRVDQEKERKKQEAEEKKAQEERLQRQKEEEENRRQEKITEMKTSLLSELPDEPHSDTEDALQIMFKLPNGNRLSRRFLKSDPIRTNFPTRDLPGISPSPEANLHDSEMHILLEKCDLCNNMVLFVHDLDS